MKAPDIAAAVTEILYMLDGEAQMPSGQQNAEVIAACRRALHALIGVRQTPAARRWLDSQTTPRATPKETK